MKVQIQTTQNVDIEYDLASIGERMGAAGIDLLIMIGYAVAMLILLSALEEGFSDSPDMWTAVIVLLFLPVFLYDVLCEAFLDGQTFGKKGMKIKVVKLDGSQPGAGAYLLRWLIALLEKSPFVFGGAIGLTVILLNGKGQRLGDLAAGTTVVKVKPAVTLDHTIFKKVEEDYTPTFSQVTKLTDRDVALIQEVLNSREQMDNPVVVGKLASRVKQILGVEPEMPASSFLWTVVKDYNYYTSGM